MQNKSFFHLFRAPCLILGVFAETQAMGGCANPQLPAEATLNTETSATGPVIEEPVPQLAPGLPKHFSLELEVAHASGSVRVCKYTLQGLRDGNLVTLSGAESLPELTPYKDPKDFEAVFDKLKCVLPKFTIDLSTGHMVAFEGILGLEPAQDYVRAFFQALPGADPRAIDAMVYVVEEEMIVKNAQQIIPALFPDAGLNDLKVRGFPVEHTPDEEWAGVPCQFYDYTTTYEVPAETQAKMDEKVPNGGPEPATYKVLNTRTQVFVDREIGMNRLGVIDLWISGENLPMSMKKRVRVEIKEFTGKT